MTRFRILLGLALATTLTFAQTQPQGDQPLTALPYTPSLDLTAMDTTADACVDFYQYSCGGWKRQNPIPPDQASWSVYGKLTDENQRFLWGILQEASNPDRPRNASEQKIGDYFEACMDEPAIEKLGAAPLEPGLREIAALKSKDELASYLGREHLAMRRSGMLFSLGSDQDYADSTQVIAFARAGGLGLPDRDYYTKTDARSQKIRDQYLAHIQRMFELLGDPSGTAAQEAKTVMSIETNLATKTLTRVQRRDPYNLFHKMDRAQLKALTPDFNWDDYLDAVRLAGVQTFNVTEPDFYREMDRLIASEGLDDWKTYLRWHLVRGCARQVSRW